MKQHYTTTWNVSERLPPLRVATAEHRITATYRHVRWKHVVCPKNMILVWIFELNILVNVSKTAIHCDLNFGRILRNIVCNLITSCKVSYVNIIHITININLISFHDTDFSPARISCFVETFLDLNIERMWCSLFHHEWKTS